MARTRHLLRTVSLARDAALELAHPTRCAGCELPGTLLCDACSAAMPLIEPAGACPRCGAPDGRPHCDECRGERFAFEAGRCVGTLDRPLSRVVTVYKDGGERRLAEPLAALMADAAGAWLAWADVLAWVPASTRARARRGFDHAELLAGALSGCTRTPAARLLVHGDAQDQRGLDRAGRRANLVGAFAILAADIPARILLVDDVMTTGATLDAASRVLRESGAHHIRAVALARKVRGRGRDAQDVL